MTIVKKDLDVGTWLWLDSSGIKKTGKVLQAMKFWVSCLRYIRMRLRSHIFIEVCKVRFQLFQEVVGKYAKESLLSCVWLLKYYKVVKSTKLV